MSMIQSLAAATLISCSTTTTVLPALDEAVKLLHQLRHVRRVQARRRFVEHVERLATLRALQFGGELDALGLAAGQFRGRLPEPDVSQADFPKHAQGSAQRIVIGKEFERCRRPSSPARRQSICPGS